MYYLLLAIFYPLSLLPFPVLYVLSDGFTFLLHRVFRYRIDVVRSNLKHAFPQYSARQLHNIEKKFYRNFCDQWLETVKLLSISKKQFCARFVVQAQPIIEVADTGRPTYTLMAHNFNFEWANVGTAWAIPQQLAGIYMPIANKAIEKLMLHIRGRSGTILIPASQFKDHIKRLEGTNFVLGLVADQNPANRNKALWLNFLNREAPFYRGPAEGARKMNAAVVFAFMHKWKRGHYVLKIEGFAKNANDYSVDEITEAYVRFIEKKIREQPENYLWTHKRWKYEKPMLLHEPLP